MTWDHFICFEETRTLFILFHAERSAYPIPKRIFVRRAGDEYLSHIHENYIKSDQRDPTGAFPVIPIVSSCGRFTR